MRRGAWHQFGDRSQRLALEQLQLGVGAGVIISVRDLSWDNALAYAHHYRDAGAHVLIDQQFYNPGFTNQKILSYPMSQYRESVSQMTQISDVNLIGIANELRNYHTQLQANGLIAPAVMYEAGRTDIADLNRQLYEASKTIGDELGIPTYATVMLGRSVTGSNLTINQILSETTSFDCDGWYFGFEFGDERIPSSVDSIQRCGEAILLLASTGKPVLHAYAGPLSLLSFGFGAIGAAVGHSQNLWQFTRGRFEPAQPGGGSGDAPPRFFSRSLWGTIIYPDETAQLPPNLRDEVLTQSPFSEETIWNTDWSRWDANKHLINIICSTITQIANSSTNARENAESALQILDNAVALHQQISDVGIILRDRTNAYQANWRAAVEALLINKATDYDFLELLLY